MHQPQASSIMHRTCWYMAKPIQYYKVKKKNIKKKKYISIYGYKLDTVADVNICIHIYQFSSVHLVVSSLLPGGLQHTRLPYPSPTSRVCLNSCLSSRRCHPTISSSVVPFSSCLNLSQHQGLFQGISS